MKMKSDIPTPSFDRHKNMTNATMNMIMEVKFVLPLINGLKRFGIDTMLSSLLGGINTSTKIMLDPELDIIKVRDRNAYEKIKEICEDASSYINICDEIPNNNWRY